DKIIAPHGIQGINQFSPCDAVTPMRATVPLPASCVLIDFEQGRRSLTSKPEGNVQDLRAMLEKRQIESYQIMIFDHIRVTLANQGAEISNESSFLLRRGRFQDMFKALVIAKSHEKNTPAFWIKRGRFQVKGESVELFIGHAAKEHSSSLHKILFN